MTQVSMTVNGGVVVADVEPRTLLADFLRGELQLTGTHLGCEQGVCGACTVVLDGRIQRSCITFAADCDGGNVTTIEGFDDDPTMQELREAFSEHHRPAMRLLHTGNADDGTRYRTTPRRNR
ncbi:aerobic-type carbon monoxide dehydrogenase small subunit (CoxS/CutS family) [Bradyrhizobium sp. JR6.1]